MPFFLKFVSFFFIICLSFPTQAEVRVLERVVAVVNGKVILLSELEESAKQLAQELEMRGKEPATNPQNEDFQQKVLDQLINQELVAEEVQRRGLEADDSTVDSAITSVMTQNGMQSLNELESALAKEGITLETYRKGIKRQIEDSRLMSEVIRPRVNLTESDFRAAYERNYAQNAEEARYRVNMIFKKGSRGKGKLQEIRKKIASGTKFEQIADLETEGPGKGEGGSIGTVALDDLHPKLGAALKNLQPNDISPVVTTERGAYLLKLAEEVKEGKTPYADVKSEIEEELRRTETNRKFESFLRSLRENALIEVKL